MADVYESLLGNSLGRSLLSTLNLPVPAVLERYSPEQSHFLSGKVLVGAASGSVLNETILQTLKQALVSVWTPANASENTTFEQLALKLGIALQSAGEGQAEQRYKAVVFDATGISRSEQARELYDFLHPVIRNLESSARVVILGLAPDSLKSQPRARLAQFGLEGLVRSIAKEVGKRGATCNLIYTTKAAAKLTESALRFFLSPRSAFVDGQIVTVGKGAALPENLDWNAPLKGKTALVTGASRGIGEAIAKTLARDGAKVICLDIPQAQDALKQVAAAIGGETLEMDISTPEAAGQIAEALKTRFDGIDIVVHNAGITRDKTLGGMPAHYWEQVVNINLSAIERINDALLASAVLNEQGRIVCVSSMSGIAGNFGQTNYAYSKSGVIGLVQAWAPELAQKQITINAVAPGFIETQMTAAIPLATREIGRRLNSLKQGGQPVDVAEAIAFFASPASSGITGNTIRVCGQNLLGA